MSAPTTIPTLRIRPRHGWAALNLLEVWVYRDVLWMIAPFRIWSVKEA